MKEVNFGNSKNFVTVIMISVSLIIGGKANTIVATTPGVKPIPKSITTGIK